MQISVIRCKLGVSIYLVSFKEIWIA